MPVGRFSATVAVGGVSQSRARGERELRATGRERPLHISIVPPAWCAHAPHFPPLGERVQESDDHELRAPPGASHGPGRVTATAASRPRRLGRQPNWFRRESGPAKGSDRRRAPTSSGSATFAGARLPGGERAAGKTTVLPAQAPRVVGQTLGTVQKLGGGGGSTGGTTGAVTGAVQKHRQAGRQHRRPDGGGRNRHGQVHRGRSPAMRPSTSSTHFRSDAAVQGIALRLREGVKSKVRLC